MRVCDMLWTADQEGNVSLEATWPVYVLSPEQVRLLYQQLFEVQRHVPCSASQDVLDDDFFDHAHLSLRRKVRFVPRDPHLRFVAILVVRARHLILTEAEVETLMIQVMLLAQDLDQLDAVSSTIVERRYGGDEYNH